MPIPSHRVLGFLALAIVIAAVPLTVFVAQKQQELRQRATQRCEQVCETRRVCTGPPTCRVCNSPDEAGCNCTPTCRSCEGDNAEDAGCPEALAEGKTQICDGPPSCPREVCDGPRTEPCTEEIDASTCRQVCTEVEDTPAPQPTTASTQSNPQPTAASTQAPPQPTQGTGGPVDTCTRDSPRQLCSIYPCRAPELIQGYIPGTGTCPDNKFCCTLDYAALTPSPTPLPTATPTPAAAASTLACTNNPIPPPSYPLPSSYMWRANCATSGQCTKHSDCPQNASDPSVNQASSNWCYGFVGQYGDARDHRCLRLEKISDIDGDRRVNVLDYELLRRCFDKPITTQECRSADVTGDGKVLLDDYRDFVKNFSPI